VRYVEQLRRYHSLFAPEQVLTLIYDDFRDDNEGVLRQVLRFLDVNDSVHIEPLRANATVRVRSTHLEDVVRTADLGRGLLARAVKGTARIAVPSRRVRKRAFSLVRERVVFGAPDAPDQSLMLELRRRFKPEVQALSEYIGRDLVTLWGYDDLG
jgi:hypothetical protein